MTDREKLIELLCADPCTAMSTDDCDTCELRCIANCYSICMADILLDNGVTFAKDTDASSKWISVEERLPEDDVIVLVWYASEYGSYGMGFANFAKQFGTDTQGDTFTPKGMKEITHWMPLPQPPREE